MPLVMLRRDAATTFRRYVRDTSGAIIETLEFEPGVPVDVPWDKFPVIERDLFAALKPVIPDTKSGATPGELIPTGKFLEMDRAEYEKIVADNAAFEAEEAATAPDNAVASTPEPLAEVVPVNATEVTDGAHTGRRSRK